MKRNILRLIVLMLAMTTAAGTCHANADRPDSLALDSVTLSLITCSPHEEIYSLYGHSALRYHNLQTGEDIAFNWGIFSFRKPFFVLRFVFGKTDYELALMPFDRFCQEYQRWGSQVTEQVLNLTDNEKRGIIDALNENALPQNRVYRYNFFYDNCSTRPRDIVEKNIKGRLLYDGREDYNPSWRTVIRQCTKRHPWATFGNDILLGVKADRHTTRSEQEFLPKNLLYDFDHTQIYTDGNYRPLVKERNIIVPAGVQIVKTDFPLTPTECGMLLLLATLVIFVLEWRRRKTYKYWDVALMTLTGLMGIVLFVMLFSEHPTTSTNLQLLLLNPLHLIYIYKVARRQKTIYWTLLLVMTLAFYAGGVLQQYAEGTAFLALCLLIRYVSNKRNE